MLLSALDGPTTLLSVHTKNSWNASSEVMSPQHIAIIIPAYTLITHTQITIEVSQR